MSQHSLEAQSDEAAMKGVTQKSEQVQGEPQVWQAPTSTLLTRSVYPLDTNPMMCSWQSSLSGTA